MSTARYENALWIAKRQAEIDGVPLSDVAAREIAAKASAAPSVPEAIDALSAAYQQYRASRDWLRLRA